MLALGRVLTRPKQLKLLGDVRDLIFDADLSSYDEEVFIWQETGLPRGTKPADANAILDWEDAVGQPRAQAVPSEVSGVGERAHRPLLTAVLKKKRGQQALGFSIVQSDDDDNDGAIVISEVRRGGGKHQFQQHKHQPHQILRG